MRSWCCDRLVETELELGNPPQPEGAADLPAQERRRALERLLGLTARFRVAEAGVEHACQLEVRRDLHARQRDEPDARIVHRAAAEQRAQLVANLFADAIWSVTVRHQLVNVNRNCRIATESQLAVARLDVPVHDCHAVTATRSIVKTSITSPTLMSL